MFKMGKALCTDTIVVVMNELFFYYNNRIFSFTMAYQQLVPQCTGSIGHFIMILLLITEFNNFHHCLYSQFYIINSTLNVINARTQLLFYNIELLFNVISTFTISLLKHYHCYIIIIFITNIIIIIYSITIAVSSSFILFLRKLMFRTHTNNQCINTTLVYA